MPDGLDLRLFELGEYSASMCGLTRVALRNATQALLAADLALAEQVISADARLDEMRRRGEDIAVALLASEAPADRDLRFMVAALRIIADLQRMGALAIHIANAARRRHPARVIPPDVQPFIERLDGTGVHLADLAESVLRSQDVDAARRLEAEDDLMDQLQRDLYGHILAPDWRHGIAAAVDIALLARFYERFADHAVSVADQVVYLVTGEMP